MVGGAVGDDEERMVPRTVIERALQDFEAHANRYDSYGDELGAALRRAGASPAAVLAVEGGMEGSGSTEAHA